MRRHIYLAVAPLRAGVTHRVLRCVYLIVAAALVALQSLLTEHVEHTCHDYMVHHSTPLAHGLDERMVPEAESLMWRIFTTVSPQASARALADLIPKVVAICRARKISN